MNRKIKVAILADFPTSALDGNASGRGGGQGCTWLPQLALSFEHHPELEIHWVILDRNLRKSVVTQKFGQYFHRLAAFKFSIDVALHYLPARYLIRRELKKFSPDVVHAWGAELIYPAALQDFSGPTIFSMQGSLTEYQRIGGLPDNWIWRRLVKSERGYVETASIVSAESIWASERVKEIKSDADCRIVDYGVHPRFFQTEWKPDPSVPYVLYVGDGGYRKGIDVLLQSLRTIENRNWAVRFAGNEHLGREVEAAGLPNAEYLGMLDWTELLRQLAGAWALVVPTRGDTGPSVVKEARVVGLPVIGTTHGGLRDYVRHGQSGWIVDPLDAEHLADALARVMSSHETAVSMGKACHEEDRTYFSSERTAMLFSRIYMELAGVGSLESDV